MENMVWVQLQSTLRHRNGSTRAGDKAEVLIVICSESAAHLATLTHATGKSQRSLPTEKEAQSRSKAQWRLQATCEMAGLLPQDAGSQQPSQSGLQELNKIGSLIY